MRRSRRKEAAQRGCAGTRDVLEETVDETRASWDGVLD